jgi:hypothetical protein
VTVKQSDAVIARMHLGVLDLISEPNTSASVTGSNALGTEPGVLQFFTADLQGIGPHAGTRIGAGVACWFPTSFDTTIATTPVDVLIERIYPINAAEVANLMAASAVALVAGELWLYEGTATGTGNIAASGNERRVNAYSFRQLLDQQFLTFTRQWAQKADVDFASAFWSEQLFAMVAWTPALEAGAPAQALAMLHAQVASAMADGSSTPASREGYEGPLPSDGQDGDRSEGDRPVIGPHVVDLDPHAGPSGPSAEDPAAGFDGSRLDRAQIVEHGVGGRHPVGAGCRRRVDHGRPAGGLVGQHGDRTTMKDPPRITKAVLKVQSSDWALSRLEAEELLGTGWVGLGWGHGHAEWAHEVEVHGPWVEDGTRHGGCRHVAVVRPFVDHVEGGHHRGATAAQNVGPESEGANMVELGNGGQQRRGHDPLGQGGQPTGETAERVQIGQQPTDTQPAAGAPLMAVDRGPAAERQLLVVTPGRWELPSLESKVIADVAPMVDRKVEGRMDRRMDRPFIRLCGRTGCHVAAPARRDARVPDTLTTVMSRSSAPLSRSSTTPPARPSGPDPSTRTVVITGPTRPSAR